MSNKYDIEMNLEDTLELDAIIENSTRVKNVISVVSGGSYDMDGIQTHTGIFNPSESGDYTLDVNGQELHIKVYGDSVVSREYESSDIVHRWKFDGSSNFNDLIGSADFSFDSSYSSTKYADGIADGAHLDFPADSTANASSGTNLSGSNITIEGFYYAGEYLSLNSSNQESHQIMADYINDDNHTSIYARESNHSNSNNPAFGTYYQHGSADHEIFGEADSEMKDRWHHLAMAVDDGNSYDFYVDGVFIGNVGIGSGGTGGTPEIGYRSANIYGDYGNNKIYIYDWAFHDAKLSQSKIKDMINFPNPV